MVNITPFVASPQNVSGRSARAVGGGNATNRALGQLGASANQAGQILLDRELKKQNFQAEVAYNDFTAAEISKLDDSVNQAEPGGFGLAKTGVEEFNTSSQEFISTLPARLRPQYEARLSQNRKQFTQQYAREEFRLGQQFYTLETDRVLNGQLQTVQANPGTLNEIKANGVKLIDESGLTPTAKAARKQAWLNQSEAAAAGSLAQTDPLAALERLTGSVGTAVGILQKEGKLAPHQIAGIIGNLQVESGFADDVIRGTRTGDRGTAFAVAQWRGSRFKALQEFARSNNADWRNISTQTRFILEELKTTEVAAGQALRAAQTVEQATEAFILFERPAGSQDGPQKAVTYQQRIDAANAAAEQLAIGADPSFSNLTPSQRISLINSARAEQQRQARQNLGGLKVNIGTRVDDAVAAISNGLPFEGAIPTETEYARAYREPEVATQRFIDDQNRLSIAEKSSRLLTGTTAENNALVEASRPVVGDENVAEKNLEHDTLRAANQKINAERLKDPYAATARAFPEEFAEIGTDLVSGDLTRVKTGLMRAQVLQEQIGIPTERQVLIPSTLAKSTVERAKDTTVPLADRFAPASDVILATDDPQQQASIFRQYVRQGMPQNSEVAFNALTDTTDPDAQGRGDRLLEASLAEDEAFKSRFTTSNPVNGSSSVDIISAIDRDVYGENAIGNVATGANFDVDGVERAGRDRDVLINAVKFRMLRGETQEDAIEGASRDAYGSGTVYATGNASVIIPEAEDPDVIKVGLRTIRQTQVSGMLNELSAQSRVVVDAQDNASIKRIFGRAASSNVTDQIDKLIWREQENGSYGLMNPNDGRFLALPGGQKALWTIEQIREFGQRAVLEAGNQGVSSRREGF